MKNEFLETLKKQVNDIKDFKINDFDKTHGVDCLQVNAEKKQFKVKGQTGEVYKSKKNNVIMGAFGISPIGMSLINDNIINKGKTYNFSDLISFELLEDDSTITSGGVGRAIVGTIVTNNLVGGVIGGVTANRKTKKVVETLAIKLNVNDFDNPCIVIPIITKPTKVGSNEYKSAYNKAQKILSMLDLIAHNSDQKGA